MNGLLRWRGFPGVFQGTFAILAAIALSLALRPPYRSEMNLGAALVWQLWWPALPFLILLTARFWCAVCPFSAVGSLPLWFRHSVPTLPPTLVRRGGPWLSAVSLGILGFLFILLSLESNGPVTAVLLLAFALGAAASALFWRGRAWCRYLCPLGMMAGLYSRLAWLRLESAGGSATAAIAARVCPLYTAPSSPRRAQDCVFCGDCMEVQAGEVVSVRFAPPSPSAVVLNPPEALATTLLMGLLLIDALRMTPLYLRYMAWTVPWTGHNYVVAQAMGILVVTLLLLAGQTGVTVLAGRGAWSWSQFARLSLVMLPLAFASQLALSSQHLMALVEVFQNLGAELGALEPGHMPPADAYSVTWPLKVVQVAMLAAGAFVSLSVTRSGIVFPRLASIGGVALLAVVLITIFMQPMSVAC